MFVGDRVLVPASHREVRVSPKEGRILSILLKEKRPMYGYEVMKYSNGEISLASVYTLLGRLERKGLVNARTENITTRGYSMPRRWYSLTSGLEVEVPRGDTKHEPPPQEGFVENHSAIPGLVTV